MVAVVDTDVIAVTEASGSAVTGSVSAAPVDTAPVDSTTVLAAARTGRRTPKVVVAGTAIVALALAGAAGWYGPRLVDNLTTPSYAGESAAAVAKDLGCTNYRQSASHDESVYQYHDQGTCVFNATKVTVTTFDNQADGDAFLTLMNGLIPVVHPTWVGAATAAGKGWNVADATNLSPKVAEAAVVKLGAGAVRVIPSAKRS